MQLTLRGLPPEIEEAIREEARTGRISLNKAVIKFLEKAIGGPGMRKELPVHDDLDRFCGIWSPEEAKDMDEHLSDIRTMDEELWKCARVRAEYFSTHPLIPNFSGAAPRPGRFFGKFRRLP